MAYRQTLDYVDSRRTNVILEWLDGLAKDRDDVKAKLDVKLRYIRTQRVLRKQWIEKLKGKNDGVHEIKVLHRNIQWRILSCKGPRGNQITMLYPAKEVGSGLKPANARAIAAHRITEIDLPGRVVIHDY